MLDKTSYFHNHIYSPSFSCMFCLMNEVRREKHCVKINKSSRTSLNEQSAFSKVSEFKPKKIPWQKLHYMVIFFISGTTLSKFKGNDILKQEKLVLRLDAVLTEKNVCRQAYHGKSFVGNHVHKMLQVIFLMSSS